MQCSYWVHVMPGLGTPKVKIQVSLRAKATIGAMRDAWRLNGGWVLPFILSEGADCNGHIRTDPIYG